ncbi:MAG: hypothetical protein JXA90_12470, partial [Planctomycetes bacterium]|nr:hypothetical protein [Planctomycetota bacterium]
MIATPRVRFVSFALALACTWIMPWPASAADYNIRLRTDSTPDFTDIESFVRTICGHLDTPQEKAIAIWRWGRRSRHQTSCAMDRGRLIWDPILHYSSYGFMNCGIISALNISVAHHAGFRGRYIQLGDHTVSEFSWDDGASWHLFDSSMSIFCYNHKGVVASCEEIKAEAACPLSGGRSEAGHFYFYHPAPACASHLGPTGWRIASDNPVEYQRTLERGASSYTDGYSVSRYSMMAQWGRRYILNLRPYQVYTRYWRPQGNDAGYYRAARGEEDPGDSEKNIITRTVRGSGVWEFRPDLSSSRWRDFVYDEENLAVRDEKPHFAPEKSGEPCRVVFKVDAANVVTSMRIEAEARCKGEGSEVRLLVSRDAGLAWKLVWSARNAEAAKASLRLVEEVAGHTEALVRFDLITSGAPADCGLQSLTITTVTQVNRLALPGFQLGTNRVRLRVGEPEESLVLWPVLHGGGYRETAADAKDVYSREETDSFYQSTIGAGVDGSPCHVTWKLVTPTEMTELTVGARVCNRMDASHVSLQCSWDGSSFREFFRKQDGSAPFDRMVLETLTPPEGARAAWIRCEFFTPRAASTYNTPGIQDIFLRAQHRPRDVEFRPLKVTYAWTEQTGEGSVERRHRHVVDSPDDEWIVEVGGRGDPRMEWVRIEQCGGDGERGDQPRDAAGSAAAVAPPADERRLYRWGRNVALGARYRVSREACAASGDDGGGELTNGVVIAPTDYFTSRWPDLLPPATAGWDGDVRVDVNLGESQMLAGALVCTHQPNDRYCHPLRVEISVSEDGETWRQVGIIRHEDLWRPPADHEPWELDRDPKYDHLPAGGRLAYR